MRRIWLMTLLALAMFFCYVHRAALSVAAPFMIKELGLNPASMGLLLSAFFWLYCLMQIPAGWVVDRFGVKTGYGIGFAIWAVAAAATGVVGGLASLMMARVVLGVGQAVAFPASARAVSNWFAPRERGTMTGIYLSALRVGQAAVVSLGAITIPLYGWRVFFFVQGALALVWLIPWTLARVPDDVTVERSSLSFREVAIMFRDRAILGMFLGYFAYDYVWFLFLTWLPGYLTLERKFTPAEMGFFSSVPFLVMSVILFCAGAASDWLIRRGNDEIAVRKAFIATGLLISCAIIPAGLVDDKMHSIALLSVSIWGLALVAPNAWTLTQAVCEKRIIGTVSGIQNFGGNLGGVIAPALTGYIVHVTGSFALAFWVAGIIAISGIVFYYTLVPARAKARIVPEAQGVVAQ